MRTLLDANAVLRYVLEDIPEQADMVAAAIDRGAEVTCEVLAECVYVLKGVYKAPRSRIAESLGILLDEVACSRKTVAAAALGFYGGSTLDFVDCLLAAECDSGRPVLTFDKKLKTLMERLETC